MVDPYPTSQESLRPDHLRHHITEHPMTTQFNFRLGQIRPKDDHKVGQLSGGTIFRYKGGLLMALEVGAGIQLSSADVVATVVLEPMDSHAEYPVGRTFTMASFSRVPDKDIVAVAEIELIWRPSL